MKEIAKGGLLAAKRLSFALQEVAFCKLKGGLSHGKTQSFALRIDANIIINDAIRQNKILFPVFLKAQSMRLNVKNKDREMRCMLIYVLYHASRIMGFYRYGGHAIRGRRAKRGCLLSAFSFFLCKFAVSLKHEIIMQETRQNRIARLLQKELSLIFQSQTRAMRGVMVSVTRCRISPDLSICTAYLSIFPSERADEIIKNITANDRTIRYELGTRVRNQLRIIPELRFFVDDSLDYIDHIDELLKK